MRSLRIINLMVILALLAVWPGPPPAPVAAQTTYDCATATGLPQGECEALVALYNSTDGANWSDNTNWLATTTPCAWYGVTCTAGQVTSLYQLNNQLNGEMPPELGNLSALTYLTLSSNQLRGNIPHELGNLSALTRLYLSGNQLSGSIPPELGNLSTLAYLNLYGNQLSGNIPPQLGNLSALTSLSLGDNQLSGNIPPELGNLSTLTSLSLSENQLSGNIPPELGNLSALTHLWLSYSQLSGPIPESMALLTALERFSFICTGLCIPSTGPVIAWLDSIASVDGTTYVCEQQPGSLGGVVSSPDSIPLAGIQVHLYRRMPSGEILDVTVTDTDVSGSYRFYNLYENTDYIVRFVDPARTYAAEYYDDVSTAAQASPLTVTTGVWRNDIGAVLAPDNQVRPYVVYLPLVVASPSPVAWTLTPFDANMEDLNGPSSWAAMYGKVPEIIVSSDGVALDVLAQDYDPATPWDAALLHIEPGTGGYVVTQALTDIPMLDRVMGLATDDAGNRYYATGVDESDVVNPEYPPLDTYRNDIVRVIKLNPAGYVLFNIDLDIDRHAANGDAEMIINPMIAATARLAIGGDEIALVHGINTDPDWNIGGARHQKALSTRLDANSGFIRRTASVWVSHSFDQRLFYDGKGILEHHLGDAYPRYIVFGRDHVSYPLFHIKGDLGENNTYTRLGNIALIDDDPVHGYIALFVTESSADAGGGVSGPRNLAIVRVNRTDNSIDPSLPDVLTVYSKDEQQTNRLRWLTHYSEASNLHAERPKLIGIGDDRYVVLWEAWLRTGEWSDTFSGVYGMVIDDEGNTLHAATLITDQHHLHRGDDAFLLDSRAAWMTGNENTKSLHIHFVDAALNYEMVTVEPTALK